MCHCGASICKDSLAQREEQFIVMCGRIQVLLGEEHSNALCIVVLQLPNPSFVNHLTRKSCQEGPGDWDSAVVVERGESAVVAQ